MLIAYWAAKGGSGTTVLATAHAVRLATARPTLLVDLDGDVPAVLGVAEPEAGVADWLAAGASVPADAVDRLTVTAGGDLRLLARGTGPFTADGARERAAVLAQLLRSGARTTIVDCGTRPGPVGQAVARAADRSILVTRSCYVALQRQRAHGLAPTEVALVEEDGRSLDATEVAAAVGAPVRTTVRVHPAVARAVDAGLLATRVPRQLARSLRHAA